MEYCNICEGKNHTIDDINHQECVNKKRTREENGKCGFCNETAVEGQKRCANCLKFPNPKYIGYEPLGGLRRYE